MYCTKCGTQTDAVARFCQTCGTELQAEAQPSAQVVYVHPVKNSGLAVLLSFLYTGLGQIYNGDIGKGIAFIIAYAVSWGLMFVLIGLITTPVLWIWGMVDAYQTAERLNREAQARMIVSPVPSR